MGADNYMQGRAGREALVEWADLRARIAELEREIETDDLLLADRNRILDAFPCPDHGPCVPYVLRLLEAQAHGPESNHIPGCALCPPREHAHLEEWEVALCERIGVELTDYIAARRAARKEIE